MSSSNASGAASNTKKAIAGSIIHDVAALKASQARYFDFYNHQRPNADHGGQPPAAVSFNQIETDQQGQRVA